MDTPERLLITAQKSTSKKFALCKLLEVERF